MSETKDRELSVFSLETGASLATRVCERLGVELQPHEERNFEDGEHKIRPLASVRGRDVYVVESLYSDDELSVNDKLARVLFFIGALTDAGASRVTMVAPYLCYSRKDRRTKSRDPLTTRYIAALFEAIGTDRIVTMDVHNLAAYENAWRIPTEHLTAAGMFVEHFAPLIGDDDVVVVSPDAGGAKRANAFRQRLQQRFDTEVPSAFIEKTRSEGVVRGGAVVGDVEGRVAILIDDLISSGTTLARGAAACREQGAVAAYAAATHGVFSSGTSEKLGAAELDQVVILDTIPPARLADEVLEERVEVLDSSALMAEAIQRLHTDGSVVELNQSSTT